MLKERIVELMHETAKLNSVTLVDPLNGDTVLLQCGLDSLGFATLVARLEEELGYDPFVMMDEPVYPRTVNDLINIYDRFKPKA